MLKLGPGVAGVSALLLNPYPSIQEPAVVMFMSWCKPHTPLCTRNPQGSTSALAGRLLARCSGHHGTEPCRVMQPSVAAQEMWADLEGPFRASVASFTLEPPGPQYIPPDKNPWLFF